MLKINKLQSFQIANRFLYVIWKTESYLASY